MSSVKRKGVLKIEHYLLRQFRCTGERIASNAIISFAYSDAPTPLTASAQSMTFG